MDITPFANLRVILALRFFRVAFGVCAVLFAAGVMIILLALFPAVTHEPFASLHYNIHFGVDAVGAWWLLFVPSGIALVLTAGNALYAARVWQREQVIAYAFAVAAVLVNACVLLHVIFIVLLNLASL